MNAPNANLAVRFPLAAAAICDGALGSAALGSGVPAGVAAAWAVFRVPNDPGNAPIRVPGPARLRIELTVWGGATVALATSGRPGLAIAFATLVVLSKRSCTHGSRG